MPRKNKGKKGKKQQQMEEEDDWNSQSGSDDGERISSKDLLAKNKKNKKNKKKNKQQQKAPTQTQTDNNDDLDASADDAPAPAQPPKKLSKKEKKALRQQKKLAKYEDSPEPDWDAPEDSPPPQQQSKGKKGKNKKGKKGKNKKQPQPQSSDDEWNEPQNQKGKKGKKNKGKNKKNKKKQLSRAEQIQALKEQRQQGLLQLGNSLVGDLDIKFAAFFDEDVKAAWEEQMFEFVTFYEDAEEGDVEEEMVYELKKEELRAAWDDITELLEGELEKAQEDREEAARERAKQAKLAEYGLKVDDEASAGPTQAQIRARKKREEKEKMKVLKERLAKIDAQKAEEERKAKIEAERERKAKEEAERKEREAAEEAKRAAEAKKNAAWSDDDDSSDDSDGDQKSKPKPKPKGKAKGKGPKGGAKGGKGKGKGKKQTMDDSSDSDDGWDAPRAAKKGGKGKAKAAKRDAMESSDEEPQQQQKKKKRGGRKKKGGGGGAQNQGKKQNQPKQANGAAKGKSESASGTTSSTSSPKANGKAEGEKKVEEGAKEQATKPKKGKQGKKAKGGEEKEEKEKPKKLTKEEKKKLRREKASKGKVKLRSPICVVMGHVDTGKTKILDHIRNSSVQDKEAGGITQQIGATYLSIDYIKEKTARLQEQVNKLKYSVPGLLFIDTPGHESFSNLRSRGSSMCDIAVLVVDLMHGLEPQTIESLKMLTARKSPFVVALNKIDVCYNWKVDKDAPFLTTFANQEKATQNDFEKRLSQVKVQFAEQEINAELYFKNKRLDQDISLVPTSAITGEGIPDLLYLIVTLTKKYMEKRMKFKEHKTKCSVLEVKQTQGFGATIDVIVSNGTLQKNDEIVVCGMNGPIVTPIKALLLPHEAQEMRVRGEYNQVAEVSASIGVRIAAVEDLSSAVAGAPMFIVDRKLKGKGKEQKRWEHIEQLKDEVQATYADILEKVDKRGRGVFVQSSTLGSLEALITFLYDQKIPISGIGIGTISKKTVMKASIMLEHQKEFAVILAFNVKCAPDARAMADEVGVRLFEAEIIYHLQDMFEAYIKDLKEKRKEAAKDVAVFPAEFQILSPEHVFNNKNPLVLGVQILRGTLRMNTPIVAKRYNEAGASTPLFLGRVDGIKKEEKDVTSAKVGDKVSVRIMGDDEQKNLQVGRSFLVTDVLCSEISRDSLDALKANFKEDMVKDKDTIQHLGELKKYFNII